MISPYLDCGKTHSATAKLCIMAYHEKHDAANMYVDTPNFDYISRLLQINFDSDRSKNETKNRLEFVFRTLGKTTSMSNVVKNI